MHRIKKIQTLAISAVLLLTLGISAALMLFPDKSAELLGYRMYTILSDSMEPKIPVGSLMIVRSLKSDEQPLANDVITFKADRFGQFITLTHVYEKSEVVGNETVYRTHPFTTQEYDPYHTVYEDIKGIYVAHIPYLGKLMSFIASPYGICLLIVFAFVLFIYHYLNEHFDLDRDVELSYFHQRRKQRSYEAVLVKNFTLLKEKEAFLVRGEIINETKEPIKRVRARLIFLDEKDEIVNVNIFNLITNVRFEVHEHRVWSHQITCDPKIKSAYIEIIEVKKIFYKVNRQAEK